MYSPHHIAFSVSDSQISVEFYKKLGFAELSFWQEDDKSLSITHLSLGGIILELFCYANSQSAPESIHANATDLPIIGTKHFGLKTSSLEAARADLAAKGIVDANIQIKQGKWYKYFFVKDPDGILVEITDESRL
jgi:catechol 2,3-dioxygenase-like lactoylglutathione lyase family enzyme